MYRCSAWWFPPLDVLLFANIFLGFSEESTVLLNMPSSLWFLVQLFSASFVLYFLFLLFDLVTGEMQRRKAVQQPGSAGRAHRLPQEQPYRLPARRASFRGPGKARDGPRVEEAGYSLRRVQEVNSWRFCIVLYYKRICKWRTSNNSIFSSVLQIPKIYGMGVTTAHPLRIVRLGLNLSKQFISYVNWILMLTVNCKKQLGATSMD